MTWSIGIELPDLPAALWELVRQIPQGRVTTYGDLAEALGSRQAARWVGEHLVDHPHDTDCPCHRVVRRTGEAGLFVTRAAGEKESLLAAEGIAIRDGRIDLERHRFTDFVTERPLAPLVQFQERIPEQVVMQPFAGTPELVAGVDVAYSASGEACGAYVLLETATGEVVWSATVRRPAAFPYIPGFLSFREIPVHLELLAAAAAAGRLARVLFVDGNGRLHPRRSGIATHLGVLAGIPTIGLGKSLLCGSVDLAAVTVDDPQPVVDRGEIVAVAMKATPRSRPVYVSPGNLIDVADAARLARLTFHGHRLPEPVHQADRRSKEEVRRIKYEE
ncbi:MAG: endonuclease V [Planctomycetales bacterium]